MGDISEMRGLIVLFVIVTVTVGLIVLIPTDLLSTNAENRAAPSVDDINNLIAWNSTLPLNMTGSTTSHETFQLNGYNYQVDVFVLGDDTYIHMYTYAQWFFFQWDYDNFRWYDEDSEVTDSAFDYTIKSSTIDNYDVPAIFDARNSRTQIEVTFAYNTTTYASFTSALSNDEAVMVFNVDWDDRNTGMNALQLVGMVLTGQLPDINPVLSFLFGFIGWAIVAAACYLAFIFTLRIIGAIFGGGGA